jgi:hypothetical protein
MTPKAANTPAYRVATNLKGSGGLVSVGGLRSELSKDRAFCRTSAVGVRLRFSAKKRIRSSARRPVRERGTGRPLGPKRFRLLPRPEPAGKSQTR